MTDRVPSGRSFTTITAVVAYLTEQGYKIGKTAVYGHYHKQLLRKRKNGTFALEDVDRYAAANLQRLDGSAVTEADAHLADPAQESRSGTRPRHLRGGALQAQA